MCVCVMQIFFLFLASWCEWASGSGARDLGVVGVEEKLGLWNWIFYDYVAIGFVGGWGRYDCSLTIRKIAGVEKICIILRII